MKKTLNDVSGELDMRVWRTVLLTPWKDSQPINRPLCFSLALSKTRDEIDELVERALGSESFEDAIARRRRQHNATLKPL